EYRMLCRDGLFVAMIVTVSPQSLLLSCIRSKEGSPRERRTFESTDGPERWTWFKMRGDSERDERTGDDRIDYYVLWTAEDHRVRSEGCPARAPRPLR